MGEIINNILNIKMDFNELIALKLYEKLHITQYNEIIRDFNNSELDQMLSIITNRNTMCNDFEITYHYILNYTDMLKNIQNGKKEKTF